VLKSEDVAILFGLTVQSVRSLTRQGKIPATRVGSTYRYDKGQLMKFMNAIEEVQT
jgi:excisionase family DNA binding protein